MTEKEYTTDEEEDGLYNWIEEFVNKEGNDYLLTVPMEFITDKFNLVGLGKYIESPDRVLKFFLDNKTEVDEKEVTTFYLLVHQRYILSKTGLEEAFMRVINGVYGNCRVFGCNNAPLIPMGVTDLPDLSTVKMYCYNCRNIFVPEEEYSKLDACAFGRTFPHFLEMTYKSNFNRNKLGKYIPRIFGFRIYEEKSEK